MATALKFSSNPSKLASYSFLRDEVRRTLLAGRKHALELVKKESAQTCWKVGKLVEEHVRLRGLSEKGRAPYGEKTVKDLARDLAENSSYLYTGLRLAREYPIVLPAEQLSLSHHEYLLSVENLNDRTVLAQKIAKENWSKRRLASEIKSLKPQKAASSSDKKFVPKRGNPCVYELFEEDGKLVIDQGFRKYQDLTPAEARGFKSGDIIEAVPGQAIRKLTGAKPSKLFTYHATLKKIVDGDTFWVKIYLTETSWLDVKLRLRGVDAPEIDTEEGKAAKAFVEKNFSTAYGVRRTEKSKSENTVLGTQNAVRVLITTTKHPDKWDRYLVDIFLSQNGKEVCLNQLLLEAGHARRVETYRDSDWEK